MIRILIADDHDIVRKGLKQIIMENPNLVVTGEATNGQEALDLAWTQDFDVAILDIAMPGRGGLDILKILKTEKPSIKIIMLSMYSEEQYAIRCIRDGASAYLTKSNASEELLQAIETVAIGKKYITPSVAERLAYYIDEDNNHLPHEKLSDRELQVFVMIGSGKSVTDIAAELSLSMKTISTYRARLLEKMAMSTNAQIIKYTLKNQLEE
ncbi:MAG: DNA-binding response regulator [Spirochaetes bacterium GWB1_59_5]|nr:MAG: DNA-binding response regulator [Spirochaetes bacterium GWB1_59_5]